MLNKEVKKKCLHLQKYNLSYHSCLINRCICHWSKDVWVYPGKEKSHCSTMDFDGKYFRCQDFPIQSQNNIVHSKVNIIFASCTRL